jgi:hypothetical protein
VNVRVISKNEGASTDIISVALSRRNLEGLLGQLNENKLGDPAQIMRRTRAGLVLVVAEEDNVHYSSDAREEESQGRAGSSRPGAVYDEAVPTQ